MSLLLPFILLTACNDRIDDASKRNTDWCWLVSKPGSGKWIRLNGNSSLPDGRYTLFYANGNVFKKGKTENGVNTDTLSYFDVNGKPLKDVYYLKDTMYEYYINNGPYKAWSDQGDLIEEATIKDHKVYDQKWHGPFSHFIKIIDVVFSAETATVNMNQKLQASLAHAFDTKDYRITAADMHALDSLKTSIDEKDKTGLAALKQVEDWEAMPELKYTATELLRDHQQLMLQVSEILEMLRTGNTYGNYDTINSLLQYEPLRKAGERFKNMQPEFQNKANLDEGQYLYLTKQYKGFIN